MAAKKSREAKRRRDNEVSIFSNDTITLIDPLAIKKKYTK